MSEGRAPPPPPPAVGEEQVGPVSMQPSTSSSARRQRELPSRLEAGAGNVGSPESVSSSIMSAVGEEERPLLQQPPTRMQKEPSLPLEVVDEGTSDSVNSSVDTEVMSLLASAARSRQWSPQPWTSSAKMQLKLQPFVKAGQSKWIDEDSPSGAQNFRSSWLTRSTRPWSPLPSTSSAGMMMDRELQPFYDPGDMTADHMYAQDLSMRSTPMGSWEGRSLLPEPSTSSAGTQFGMEPRRTMGSWEARSLSPQPSTSSACMQFGMEPRRTPMGSWEGRSVSPQPSTSSAGIQFGMEPRTPMGSWEARSMSPQWHQPSTSSAGMQLEMEQFAMTGNVKSADSTGYDFSLAPQDTSAPWERIRPWSPTASTLPAAKMLEVELMSVNKEGGGADGIYSRPARNISSTLGGGGSGSWSPQTTTMSEVADEDVNRPPAAKQFIDYSEVGPDIRAAPIRRKLRRWPPQQLTTAAQRAQLEMQTAMQAGGATSADSEVTRFAQNLSMTAGGERKKRPWSPQPSTSTAAMVQLKLTPLSEAIECEADSFSMSVMQNLCALVEDKKMRTRSPQPSTSTAPMQVMAGDESLADDGYASARQNISVPVGEGVAPPAPESSTLTPALVDAEQPPVEETAQENPANPPVYAHVPHNISNIPQLRGLKAGRRHGRLRRLNTQNKINEKYGPMIQYFGPMVAEESAKKQTHHILIASALDHFANTINQIVDKHEGKADTTGFTERLEDFTRRMVERREKRRENDPNATEKPLPRPPSPPLLSDAEINRRLREETEAAVEALLTGDRSKERPPDRFAEILKSFQDAYILKKH